MRLLDLLAFDPNQDGLWLTGDLVARGEDSRSTLAMVKQLSDAGCCHVVLGNHDLNLLAVWRGIRPAKDADKTAAIFADSAHEGWLHWLRRQPLIRQIGHSATATRLLVHAGLPPCWGIAQAFALAGEVEQVLSGDLAALDGFLHGMYGAEPSCWQADLQGQDRLRCITNYLTRMRLCDQQGMLEFGYKDGLDAPMPHGYRPWFGWQPQFDTNTTQLYFGHWAALAGQQSVPYIRPLDGGYVWGGALLAYRLEDGKTFAVQSTSFS